MSIKKIRVKNRSEKKEAEIRLKFSEFEIPPMRDVLVIGRRAPVGPEAAKRMADAVSPDRFVIISVNDNIIEAILLRKALLQLVPQERLIPIIIEEAKKIMQEENVVKIGVEINISVKRVIEL